jgi:hypothetical protein
VSFGKAPQPMAESFTRHFGGGGDELPGGLGVVIVETLQLEKTQ